MPFNPLKEAYEVAEKTAKQHGFGVSAYFGYPTIRVIGGGESQADLIVAVLTLVGISAYSYQGTNNAWYVGNG